jgi:hypothetical protein
MASAMRLDILSAILTVFSMTEVGQKRWQGWALAFANSVVVCILAVHVAPKQWALIPPNVLCLFIYARNLRTWKHAEDPQHKKAGRVVMASKSETHRNLGRLSQRVRYQPRVAPPWCSRRSDRKWQNLIRVIG